VYSAHAHDQSLFILSKLAQHIGVVNVIRVIIRESLQASEMSDGARRRSTDLPYAFGNVIGDGKDLIRVLVEEHVAVAKMGSTHVPEEVLFFR
jgi:hypothetical protein